MNASNLTAIEINNTLCVEDINGGVWTPNEEAAAELAGSQDPAKATVALCIISPMRGDWSS
jgi:hypothetical protein